MRQADSDKPCRAQHNTNRACDQGKYTEWAGQVKLHITGEGL